MRLRTSASTFKFAVIKHVPPPNASAMESWSAGSRVGLAQGAGRGKFEVLARRHLKRFVAGEQGGCLPSVCVPMLMSFLQKLRICVEGLRHLVFRVPRGIRREECGFCRCQFCVY